MEFKEINSMCHGKNEIIVTMNEDVDEFISYEVVDSYMNEEYDDFPFEVGMKAKITDISIRDDSNGITFDFSEFEEYNKKFEHEIWVVPNTDDREFVKYSESVYYPKDCKVEIRFRKGANLPFILEVKERPNLDRLRLEQTPQINYGNIKLAHYDIEEIENDENVQPQKVDISVYGDKKCISTVANEENYYVIYYLINGEWTSLSKKLDDENIYVMDLEYDTDIYDSIEDAEKALVKSIKEGKTIVFESTPILDALMEIY